jgi:hypothetical protein
MPEIAHNHLGTSSDCLVWICGTFYLSPLQSYKKHSEFCVFWKIHMIQFAQILNVFSMPKMFYITLKSLIKTSTKMIYYLPFP